MLGLFRSTSVQFLTGSTIWEFFSSSALRALAVLYVRSVPTQFLSNRSEIQKRPRALFLARS